MAEKERSSLKEEILSDYTKDARNYVHLLKIVVICLCIVISLLVVGFVTAFTILETNHQNRMTEVANHASDKIVELLSEYEWQVEYEIETTGNENLSGNVFVEK